jgi:hypothetical protein
MNIMLIPSLIPAPLVAPPAGQQRVCHRWMHSEQARGTSRRASTCAEVVNSSCPGGRLNTGIGMRAQRDHPKSP